MFYLFRPMKIIPRKDYEVGENWTNHITDLDAKAEKHKLQRPNWQFYVQS